MKKKAVWTEVEGAGGGSILPNGGYVIKIVGVEDVPQYDYLNIYYDVAEGDKEGFFSDLSEDDMWRHKIRQGYEGWQEKYFKGLLESLEDSNPNFSIEKWQTNCNENDLVGLIVGAIITKYHKVNTQGNLSFDYNAIFMSADRIRSGNFTVPDDKWSDEAKLLNDEQKASGKSEDSGFVNPFTNDLPF